MPWLRDALEKGGGRDVNSLAPLTFPACGDYGDLGFTEGASLAGLDT